MALELRPGGRIALVAAGVALAWLGFDRAGWTPASWPHPFPPAVEEPLAPPTPAPGGAAPASGAVSGGFAFAEADATCSAPVRAAVPRHRVAPAGLAVVPVASGRDALALVAAGEAEAALVTVSELVAAWELASARAAPRIAATAGGSGSGLAVSLRIADERGLETARIAAVPGSADEYLALGILARAGIARHWPVPVADGEAALALLERGEVDAAAAPLPALEPAIAAGRARLLAGPVPLDPAVWVVAGGGCRPPFPAGGAEVLDLPAAWAAAHRIRGGRAPADVLGVLDRPLLRAFLAAGGSPGAEAIPAAHAPAPAGEETR